MIFNKGRGGLGLVLVLALFFLLPLVSAVKPVENIQTFTEGYELRIPMDNLLEIGADHEFETHVYNISNGYPIISGITCYFHLYNQRGKHTLEMEDATASHTFDYSFDVMGGNITEDIAYYVIQCNSTTLGGFHTAELAVTNSGTDDSGLSEAQLFFIFFLLGYALILLGWKFKNNLLIILGGMMTTGEGIWLFTNNLGTFASTSPQMVIFAMINLTVGLIFLFKGSLDFMEEGLW